MTTAIKRRRGTTTEHTTFTGLEGELTVDSTKDTVIVHDGATVGGFPLAKESLVNANPSSLTSIDGASTAADDKFLVFDTSALTMKQITRAELNNAMEADALANVTITGGTINGTTIGASTAAAGTFTTLTTSSTVTLNGGTANGVTYLNGSKVLTSGTALTFDGTSLGVGTTLITTNQGTGLIVGNSSGGNISIGTNQQAGGSPVLYTDLSFRGYLNHETARIRGLDNCGTLAQGVLQFYTASLVGSDITERMCITSAGNVGIGTSSTTAVGSYRILDINGTAGGYIGLFAAGTKRGAVYAGAGGLGLESVGANPIEFYTNNALRATLDASGNLGLGVTPSAWSGFKVFQVNAQSALVTDASSTYLSTNWYNDGSNKFIGTGYASVYSQEAGAHKFFTSSASGTAGNAISFTPAMTLDASGNLGIGTSLPSQKLSIGGINANNNTNQNSIEFLDANGNNNFRITGGRGSTGNEGYGVFSTLTGGVMTERVRIESSGNVGIAAQLQVAGNATIGNYVAATNVSLLFNGVANKAKRIIFNTSGAENWLIGMGAASENDAFEIYNGNGQMALTFAKATSNASFVGNLLVGTTLANSGITLLPSFSSAGSSGIDIKHVSTAATGEYYITFQYNNGVIGLITQSGTTAVSYNTTSDYRLKENIVPLTGALARISTLKPCTYTWKSAPDEVGEGFIAHELAEVCPQAVTGEKDAMRTEQYEVTPAVKDEEGNTITEAVMGDREVPSYQGIDTSFLVATLTAAIQEQQALIVSLTARLDAAGL